MKEFLNEELQNALDEYIQNPRDALVNFKLGKAYENLRQYVAANHYLLRAAEFSKDGDEDQFTALIDIAYNFIRLGDRDVDADIMADYAGAIDMNDPRYHVIKCITACKRGKWINLLNRSQMAHQAIEEITPDDILLDRKMFRMYEGIANLYLGRFDTGKQILDEVINEAEHEKIIDIAAKSLFNCGLKVASKGIDKYQSRLGEDFILYKELARTLSNSILELNLNSGQDIKNLSSFDEEFDGIIVTQDEKLLPYIQLNRGWQTFSNNVNLKNLIDIKFKDSIGCLVVWNPLTKDQLEQLKEVLKSGVDIKSIIYRHFDQFYDPTIDPLNLVLDDFKYDYSVMYGLNENLLYLSYYNKTGQDDKFVHLNEITDDIRK